MPFENPSPERCLGYMLAYLFEDDESITDEVATQIALFATIDSNAKYLFEPVQFTFEDGVPTADWERYAKGRPPNLDEQKTLVAVANKWVSTPEADRSRLVLEQLCDNTSETHAEYRPGAELTIGEILSVSTRNMPVSISRLWTKEVTSYPTAMDIPVSLWSKRVVNISGPAQGQKSGINLCVDFGDPKPVRSTR